MTKRTDRWMNAAVVVFALAACISVGLAVRRSFFTSGTVVSENSVKTWAELADGRTRTGPTEARVSVVVFSDVRCPHCQQSWENLSRIRSEHEQDVSVVYRHFPLSWGMYSTEPARASECIARAGRLSKLFQLLQASKDASAFSDSLIKGYWMGAAIRSGVVDTAAFSRCMSSPDVLAQIEEDIELARKLDVKAVPTLFVNGTRIVGDDASALRRVVDDELARAGKSF